ncbi:MAG: sugar-binding transcriptional regulator [Eubacteriales bacterium]
MDYSKNLLIKVSELYYNQNLNQQQIADKLNVSRVKVSRLLTEARNRGIVQIDIKYPKDNCISLENLLEERYHLEEAVIISTGNKSVDLLFTEVTSTVSQLIEEKVNHKDIIGLAWGRTVKKVVDKIGSVNKKVKIVQLLGNIGSSNVSGDVIARKLAHSFDGEMFLLPTPAIVEKQDIKEAMMRDGNIRSIFNMQKDCTIAIVGIGDVSEQSTLVLSGYLSDEEVQNLKKDGAVGEVCGRFIDVQGNICDNPINQRVLGIALEDLKKIPCVIAVATGEEKLQSIKAVLNTGVIDVIVTDEMIAKKILQE